MALLNETSSYAGALTLQAGGGSSGYGGGVTMYGHSHASYPGAVWVGFSSGTSTGILFGSGGNGVDSELMRLTSTGLGIGTSSPTYKLDVQSATSVIQNKSTTGTNASYYIANNTGGDFYIGRDNSTGATFGTNTGYTSVLWSAGLYPMTFHTNGIERLRISDTGNLGLGVTPSAWVNATASQVGFGAAISSRAAGSTASDMTHNAFWDGSNWKYVASSVGAARYQMTGANAGSTHAWFVSAGGTAGNAISFTQALTLDNSGNLGIGTTSPAAKLQVVSGNIRLDNNQGLEWGGANNYIYGNETTDIVAIATNGNERARITSGGDLLVGRTSASAVAPRLDVQAANFAMAINTTNGGSDEAVRFYNNGSVAGSITTTSTTTAYNVSSDQRLKKNIQDAPAASDLIDAIQVRSFDWKFDDSHQRYGMVAQELLSVAPEAVYKPEDPDDMMAVDYSKLVPMLVKEIQSLRARVAALESK
jgi:hypothetical protein